MSFYQDAVLIFISLDAFTNVPLFVAALKRVAPARQRWVLIRENLIAFGVLLAVLFAGSWAMARLGLSQPALGISSAIIIFLIGLRMLFPSQQGLFGDDVGDGEPLVVPLAIPLIAGPWSVATLLLLVTRSPEMRLELAGSLTLAWLASAVILMSSMWISRFLGPKILSASERLMGVLMIAIAVQQFIDGLTPVVQHLKSV